MFVVKARSLPYWRTFQILYAKVGSWPCWQTIDYAGKAARDKPSSLLNWKKGFKIFSNLRKKEEWAHLHFAGDQCSKTFYGCKAPFTRTVALPIFVTSDQFCQAVCPTLPGFLTNFEIGIFLSLCLILCNVMSVSQMLTKIGWTAWQNQSDSKNRTNFGGFM